MTPVRALMNRLSGSGVTLRLDGDAIVHRGPRSVLSPDVLANLRRHKAEIVAELQRQAEIGAPGFLGTAGGNGCKRDEVNSGEASAGSWHADAEALRCRIVAALDRVPAPRDQRGRRLIAETRKFLKSAWWTEAITCGWPLEALFGVDCTAPMDWVERWGLVPGLAWAAKHGDAIEHLDAERAVICCYAGSTMKDARRIELRFMPTASSVVWWECPALVGEVERPTFAMPQRGAT